MNLVGKKRVIDVQKIFTVVHLRKHQQQHTQVYHYVFTYKTLHQGKGLEPKRPICISAIFRKSTLKIVSPRLGHFQLLVERNWIRPSDENPINT